MSSPMLMVVWWLCSGGQPSSGPSEVLACVVIVKDRIARSRTGVLSLKMASLMWMAHQSYLYHTPQCARHSEESAQVQWGVRALCVVYPPVLLIGPTVIVLVCVWPSSPVEAHVVMSVSDHSPQDPVIVWS